MSQGLQNLRAEARAAASEVLSTYWDGTVPVDPIAIARKLGVQVFNAQLGDDEWGMIIGSEFGADIYLDEDQPPTRYRFSCAHELGHYIDHQRANVEPLPPGSGYVDKRSTAGAGTRNEIYANEFAASILMPEDPFRRMASENKSDFLLAITFDVSPDAVKWRRYNLGLSE